jgi:hypothetical protein
MRAGMVNSRRVLAGLAACAAFAALGAGSGCTPTDPDLERPCGSRRPPSVVMGTGSDQFLPVGAGGVLIETDPTLGFNYVWMAVACRGLGPDVNLTFGIDDVDTGLDLTTQLSQRVELTYDGDLDRDEVWGLIGQFHLDATSALPNTEALLNRPVSFWADATDACYTKPIHGSATTLMTDFDPTTCMGCLSQQCGPELAACGAECLNIQACLDAYCDNLSALGSPDEDICQVWCQSQHPTGKKDHLAMVSCIQTTTCQPPCSGYSIDYNECTAAQETSACAAAKSACATPDCQAYQTCTGACTTWPECQACAAGAGGAAGEKVYEAYQLCLEQTCIAQSWLPHLSQ